MRSHIWPITLYVLAASAQSNNDQSDSGSWDPPGVYSAPGGSQSVFKQAGQAPNDTNSLAFSRTFNNTRETWGWRINLSDIAVPNKLTDLGLPSANFSEDLHIANVQWQLDWPGSSDQSLQSLLQERNMSVYVNARIADLPTHVTSNYSDADNGDCAAILGTTCTQALSSAVAYGSPDSLSDLDGCQATLDVGTTGLDTGFFGFGLGPGANASDRSALPDLQSNDTLFYLTTDTYAATNLTLFSEAEVALQLLTLHFETGALEHGDDGGPTVLCRILRPAGVSAAAGLPFSAPALWGLVVLSALFMWS